VFWKQDKNLIFMAKYYCVRLHVALGLALSVGLVLAPKVPAAAVFWYLHQSIALFHELQSAEFWFLLNY
jgi:hypothetical protein